MKHAFMSTIAATTIACLPMANAKGPQGEAPLVPLTGACNTTFSATAPSPPTFPPLSLHLEIEGTCNLLHLGSTQYYATQDAEFKDGVYKITHTSIYVAANGDWLLGTVTGTGTFLPNGTVALTGTETYHSGDRGRFRVISPGSHADIAGVAQFTSNPFVNPVSGIGAFTISGEIGYQK